jgi:phenylpyruvate tautomerase PptA (4-oxalocrotonate tautomerase family)
MPFVRISLHKDLELEVKKNISTTIHEALIKEFNIPENDYFHIIEELEKHQIKFPDTYLNISHSENIVFIQIVAGIGRTQEQKHNLYSEIARGITDKTDIRLEDIIIILIENNVDNWSFGLGEIQKFTHL